LKEAHHGRDYFFFMPGADVSFNLGNKVVIFLKPDKRDRLMLLHLFV
jgi:hypothetical protein